MLVTPYLISMATPEPPGHSSKEERHRGFRVIAESSITEPERAEPAWPPAVESAPPTTADEECAIGR